MAYIDYFNIRVQACIIDRIDMSPTQAEEISDSFSLEYSNREFSSVQLLHGDLLVFMPGRSGRAVLQPGIRDRELLWENILPFKALARGSAHFASPCFYIRCEPNTLK
jgi:hypothetical protein